MKTAKEYYEEATLLELSNPSGTRMDIIFRAMRLQTEDAIRECAAVVDGYCMPSTLNEDVCKDILNLISELK